MRSAALPILFFLFIISIALRAQESTSVIVDEILIEGNKKTKDFILLKELTFQKGDTLDTAFFSYLAEENERLLINTALFIYAKLSFHPDEQGLVKVKIRVQERWYIFPVPIFELADRNFNVWWDQFERDLSRTNLGIWLKYYNFTGRYDPLSVKAQWGFTPKLEIFYSRPYFHRNNNHGVGAFVSVSMNKRIPVVNEENLEVFLNADEFIKFKFRTGLQYLYRQSLFDFHQAEIKFNRNTVEDTVAELNEDYFLDGRTTQQFFTLTYQYINNRVDNRAYPLAGSYSKFLISKIGLGIMGDVNQLKIEARHNQYFDLGKKFYVGTQLIAKVNFGEEQPYYNLEGMGYCQNFVRGYELYVIDGQHYGLFKSNFKRHLFGFSIKNPLSRSKTNNHIPFDFYLKTYGDLGYVIDRYYEANNSLTNEWLVGGGIGLDMVTFYDWVFRFEYSFNRLGENGLFLHIVLDLNTYEDCNLW